LRYYEILRVFEILGFYDFLTLFGILRFYEFYTFAHLKRRVELLKKSKIALLNGANVKTTD